MPIHVDASQASGPLAFFSRLSADKPKALRPTEGVASLVDTQEKKATSARLSLQSLAFNESQRSQDSLQRTSANSTSTLPATSASARSALRNVNRGVTMLQTADQALADIQSTLTTLKSLATQSADPNVTDDRRVALSAQFAEALAKIDPFVENSTVDDIKLIGSSEPTPPTPATGAVVTAIVAQTDQLSSDEKLTFADSGVFAGLSKSQREITLEKNDTQADVIAKINADEYIGARVQASVDAGGFLVLTSVATGSGATFAVESDKVAHFQRTGIGKDPITATPGTDEIPGTPGKSDLELQVDIGTNPTPGDDRTSIHLDASTAADLGVNDLAIGTQAGAAAAVTALDSALTAVQQNRIKASVQLDSLSSTAAALTTRRTEETSLQSILTASQAQGTAATASQTDARSLLVTQANTRPDAVLRLLG